MFNLTNTPSFGEPDHRGNCFRQNEIPTQAGNFGKITSTSRMYAPRDIKFALRLLFWPSNQLGQGCDRSIYLWNLASLPRSLGFRVLGISRRILRTANRTLHLLAAKPILVIYLGPPLWKRYIILSRNNSVLQRLPTERRREPLPLSHSASSLGGTDVSGNHQLPAYWSHDL